MACAQLKPLGVDDIDAYIAKRVAGKIEVSDERRRGMAEIMADLTNGHPLEVASAVGQISDEKLRASMTGGSDSAALAEFRSLLEDAAQPGPDSPVLMTDGLVGEVAGALLRRCAIPHDFDRALLRHLGDLEEAQADERYAQFAELSLMQISDSTLSMHERWRQPLWHWWLGVTRRDEFRVVSEELVDWFSAPTTSTGEVILPRGAACST